VANLDGSAGRWAASAGKASPTVVINSRLPPVAIRANSHTTAAGEPLVVHNYNNVAGLRHFDGTLPSKAA
jgi:hypothetical protein